MVFSSIVFIFKFLPLFFMLYGVCPSRWKNVCLFIGSLIFYFYGVRDNPFYFFLFLFSILINYIFGGLIGRNRRKSKKILAMGIAYNLSWLVLFKYLGFIMQILSQLLNVLGFSVNFPLYQPVLPIGISFYTFQAVSYLIDVYGRKIPYERSLSGFGMYLSMFPQLIAGPIVTYSAMRDRIRKRRCSFSMIEEGLREFTIGLGMKVLIMAVVSVNNRNAAKSTFRMI